MSHLRIPNHQLDRESSDKTAEETLLPALVNAYREEGYEAGHSRAVSDVLALMFEATEDFVALHPETAVETRRLLHAFVEHLHHRLRRERSDHTFADGLGI
jgi:hypothetical protein